MGIRACRKVMRFGRKLFRQEQAKWGGIVKFAYVRDTATGETIFYSPDITTSARMRKCLDAEFIKV